VNTFLSDYAAYVLRFRARYGQDGDQPRELKLCLTGEVLTMVTFAFEEKSEKLTDLGVREYLEKMLSTPALDLKSLAEEQAPLLRAAWKMSETPWGR
jgi:hypothetical protein